LPCKNTGNRKTATFHLLLDFTTNQEANQEKQMNEHPIIFSTPMVQAILSGIKTQTRRVVKPQPPEIWNNCQKLFNPDGSHLGWSFFNSKDPDFHGSLKRKREFPYGRIGEQLWVRESFNNDWCDHAIYKANGGSAKEAGYKHEPRWKPSIHMPRKLSRIILEITDIRVERVQDITDEDAKAEGVTDLITELRAPTHRTLKKNGTEWALTNLQNEYAYLWDKINGKRGFGWEKNCWVWVIEFKRIKQ
jgi:hypothetical protein